MVIKMAKKKISTEEYQKDWDSNPFRKPKIEKVVVNISVGQAGEELNKALKIVELLTMLNIDFIKWVIIALSIAGPLTWFIMEKWLQNFAYKTEIKWWIFAFSGIISFLIALITVSWQSWKVSNKNPVEALRYE